MARSSVKISKTRVRFPKKIEIKVGVLDGDKRYSDESVESVGEIAEKHEFGLGVPQRSWLREWFDAKAIELKDGAKKAFEFAAQTSGDPAKGARIVAAQAQASIKGRIADGEVTPPITNPTTIAIKQEKGFNPPYTPLVETGLLLSSVTAEAEVTR